MQMKDVTNHLDTKQRKTLGEVVRFGIVGGVATLIQLGVYELLLSATGHNIANTIGYGVSFIFNFFASTLFTFRVKANAKHGAGFALSHLINYLLQMAVLNAATWLGCPPQWAPIPMFCVCIPTNFILVRFFLKR